MRAALGLTLGAGTFLIGQPAVELTAWWLTGGTATFDDPLVNAARFGTTGTLAIAVAFLIGLPPARRRHLS